jgi:hypothetical protein
MYDADLPDVFDQRVAALGEQASGWDLVLAFIALAREPISSDEDSTVDFDVVRVEAGSQASLHAVGLKREMSYLEPTPDGGEASYSRFYLDMAFARAPGDDRLDLTINYTDRLDDGDLDEVLSSLRAHGPVAQLLERQPQTVKSWLEY